MLMLCKGWNKSPITLFKNKRYHDAEIARKVQAVYNPVSPLVRTPIWLSYCSQHIPLNTKEEVELACKLIALQHNESVSDSESETSESSETSSVCSESDMEEDYEDLFYIE
jgi:hypothetical protein